MKKVAAIKELREVGRYAVGIQWSDGHDSIYPLQSLRRRCPCRSCLGAAKGVPGAQAQRLVQFCRLGEKGVFAAWADGHETLFTVAQLRALCGCALCTPEPERPLTQG